MGVDLLIEAVFNCTVRLLNSNVAVITPTDSSAVVRVSTTGVQLEQLGFKSASDLPLDTQYYVARNDYLVSGPLSTRPQVSKGQNVIVSISNHAGGEILVAGW